MKLQQSKSEVRHKWLSSDVIQAHGAFDPNCLIVAKVILSNDIPPIIGDYTRASFDAKAPIKDVFYYELLCAYLEENYRAPFISRVRKVFK